VHVFYAVGFVSVIKQNANLAKLSYSDTFQRNQLENIYLSRFVSSLVSTTCIVRHCTGSCGLLLLNGSRLRDVRMFTRQWLKKRNVFVQVCYSQARIARFQSHRALSDVLFRISSSSNSPFLYPINSYELSSNAIV